MENVEEDGVAGWEEAKRTTVRPGESSHGIESGARKYKRYHLYLASPNYFGPG